MRKKALEAGVSLFVGESGGGEGAHSLGGTSKRQAKEGCGNGVFLSPSPPPSLSLSGSCTRGTWREDGSTGDSEDTYNKALGEAISLHWGTFEGWVWCSLSGTLRDR